jgi:hypothetical protein
MNQKVTTSNEGAFWDNRFHTKGAIWGNGPSPTAQLAARYLHGGECVLEVGFGYGRDVCYLLRQG